MNARKNALGPMSETVRGFQRIEFPDIYGRKCSLQQSSLAEMEPPGTSAIWLGVEGNRMHLDREMVSDLIKRLGMWLQGGYFDG